MDASDIALTETRQTGTAAGNNALDSNIDQQDESSVSRAGRQEFSLPPADGGKDAWLFLAGCFMVEALVWGRWQGYHPKPNAMNYC